jgi:hypothetical protein
LTITVKGGGGVTQQKDNKMSKNRNNNATATATATPEKPTETQVTVAKVTLAEPMLFTVERPFEAIARDISFDRHDTVTVKETVTVHELGQFMASRLDDNNSITVQVANCLRHARKLSKVTVPVNDELGHPTGEKREMTATAFLEMRLKARSTTVSAFNNSLQIVEAMDFLADNPELLGKVSPFTIKNAMGPLRSFGALPPADKSKAYTEGALKLTLGEKADPTALAIVDSLSKGVSQKKLQAAINMSEAAKKKAKEEAEAKAKADAEAKAKAEAEARGETPVETPTAPTAPAVPVAPAVPSTDGLKTVWKAEAVLGMIVSAIGAWQKSVEQGESIDALRKMCAEDLQSLAKLGGFKCVPLDK